MKRRTWLRLNVGPCSAHAYDMDRMMEEEKKNKVMEAHRKVMMANHPDAGGSPFVSTKVNEAKEVLLGKKTKSGVF